MLLNQLQLAWDIQLESRFPEKPDFKELVLKTIVNNHPEKSIMWKPFQKDGKDLILITNQADPLDWRNSILHEEGAGYMDIYYDFLSDISVNQFLNRISQIGYSITIEETEDNQIRTTITNGTELVCNALTLEPQSINLQ